MTVVLAADRPAPVTLRLGDIDRTNMAGAGNHLWRHSLPDAEIVLKVYEGTRSRFEYLRKSFGNVVLTGRTSQFARTRSRVESDCVETWTRHGFRCFAMYPQVTVDGLPRDVYMAYEYVPGVHFRDYFRNPGLSVDEKMATWRRWLPEWQRRHVTAVAEGDSRLIHENGDVKHVMLHDGEFVYFDFEMIFTSQNVRLLVGREINAYMRSVGRFFGDDMYERMLDLLIDRYTARDLLAAAYDVAFRHPNPLMRALRWLDRKVKPTNRKRYSKYAVARDIGQRLGIAG